MRMLTQSGVSCFASASLHGALRGRQFMTFFVRVLSMCRCLTLPTSFIVWSIPHITCFQYALAVHIYQSSTGWSQREPNYEKNEVFVDPKIVLKPFKNDYFGPRGCQKIEFFIISGSIWTYSQPSTSRFYIVPWRIWRFCFVSSLFEQGAGLGIKFWGLQFQNLFCTVYDRTWCTFWRLAF